MNPERERRIRRLFDELCGLEEPERTRRLEELVEGDDELFQRVQALFRWDEKSNLLSTPALGPDFRLSGPFLAQGVLEADSDEEHPEEIGPYRILGILGSGGMGVVYRALDRRLEREVAFKVLRRGMVGAEARALFEQEAKALARLGHPNVATAFEAGTADYGHGDVAFLAMELIPGAQDLVHHADGRGLDLRARVGLLALVCEATHHAHQKFVIHRDLKPGNVLVGSEGVPKIVDYGLARLADARREDGPVEDSRRILGTLSYISPEQLDPEAEEIDTRADVFALGATGYHLLTGSPLFSFEGKSLAEAIAIRRGREPHLIEDRATKLDPDLTAVLTRALRREREERYASAGDMAEDLKRWLAFQPVEARFHGRLERAVLFTRRNRLLVGSAVALAVTLSLGIAGTGSYALEVEAKARHEKNLRHYFEDMLQVAGQPSGQVEHLARTLELLSLDFADGTYDSEGTRPAEIEFEIGVALLDTGKYEKAFQRLSKAWILTRDLRGTDSPEALEIRQQLGIADLACGRPLEARDHFEAVLEARVRVLGPENLATLESAHWLARVLLRSDEVEPAEVLLRDAFQSRRALLGENALETLETRQLLAFCLHRRGKVRESEAEFEALLAIHLGNHSEDYAYLRANERVVAALYEVQHNYGTLLLELGRNEEGRGMLEAAFEGYRQLRGEDHPDTQHVLANLAMIAEEAPADAGVDAQAPAEGTVKNPLHYGVMSSMAAKKFYRGEYADAERDLRTAIEGLAQLGGQERFLRAASQSLAALLVADGRLDEAQELLDRVLDAHVASGTDQSPLALAVSSNRADIYRRKKLNNLALDEARGAYEKLERAVGESTIQTLAARITYSAALADAGCHEEALGESRAALGIASTTYGDEDPFTEMFRVRHGTNLRLLGRFEAAEAQLLQAYHVLVEHHTLHGHYTVLATKALIELYRAWDRPAESTTWQHTLDLALARPR